MHKISVIWLALLLNSKLGFTKAAKLLYDGPFEDIKA